MKKSVRKTLFFILVFSFFLALFAGCSNSSAGGHDNDIVDNQPLVVEFGTWPQTIKAAEVEIDETDTKEVGLFTYYRGSDGEWYAKIIQNDFYGSRGENKYSNGEVVGSSGYAYFKVEPIKWKLITDDYSYRGQKLLLAENVLFRQEFYPVDSYYDEIRNRTIDGKTVYANNYKYSKIRAYLNGLEYENLSYGQSQTTNNEFKDKGFLQTAFSDVQQSVILQGSVENRAFSTTDCDDNLPQATDFACENTMDKIFLLSEAEVTNPYYGFSKYDSRGEGNTRIRKATDFAKASGVYLGNLDVVEDWWGAPWCLRSPLGVDSISNQHYIREIGPTGGADSYAVANEGAMGIVPALLVDSCF